ncbi:MAG: DUF1326 domain-containing protein, partial [Terriglobia bacterium]
MRYLATAFFILIFAVDAHAQAPAVAGDYVEARSGHVYTCGCLYSGESVTGGKEAILVWRILSGEYEGTSLEGIRLAAVVVGESNLGAPDEARRSVVYLDGITRDAQEQAVLALWRREYAKVLGEVRAVHRAPITFDRQGELVNVEVPGVVRVQARKARLPQDAHPGSFLWYSPFTPLGDPTLAT